MGGTETAAVDPPRGRPGTEPESPVGTEPESPVGTEPASPAGAVSQSPAGAVTESQAGTVTESSAGAVTESQAGTVTESSAGTVTESPVGAVTESSAGAPAGGGVGGGGRRRGRVKAAAVVVAGSAFVVGGALLAPDPGPVKYDGWVPEPVSSATPGYVGPGPVKDVVLADFAAATGAAGLGPGTEATRPALAGVVDCAASWDSFGAVDDTRVTALVTGLTGRGWQVTLRRTEPAPAVTLTKGTWVLVLAHEKPAGAPEHLSLLALRNGPACDEEFKKAEAARRPSV
ncbi:hypothetical protein ACGFX2_02250 [Streptomyces goshikiensis]|uniref:hypothetical protein n=1 Tax=Streptomyces goshikiensis TaxID=1942 RepID=UPI003719A477